MNNEVVVWLLLLVAFVCANLPFINNRLFLIKAVAAEKKKPIQIRLVECLLLYFVVGLVAMGLEQKTNGQIHTQDWEFFAITFFMFMVLAIPGFIYRYTFLK